MTSWHDYPAAILGTTEAALLEWFAANVHTGETWMDVGAHYGYTALALCRLTGSSGRVFAFEPVLATAGYLASTQECNRLPQLIVVPFGLGPEGPLSLATAPVERGMATHQDAPGPRTNIYIIGLDQVWRLIQGDDPRIDGIKIDVQGMEHETVRGMLGVIRRWRPKLIIEFHAGVDRTQLVRDLTEVGYQGSGLPIESDDHGSGSYLDNCSYLFLPANRL
jgi:FkbM family methyltransferase